MLIRFSVENFLSFCDRQTLDLTAARTCKERREENTFPIGGKDSLLRTIGIYGANASGKSNLFGAFDFFTDFLRSSFGEREATEMISVIPFLYDAESQTKPSTFEIEFSVGEVWYKYGFSVTEKAVVAEWLYFKDLIASAFKPKFVRKIVEGEDSIEVAAAFVGADDMIVEKTRENALFLSTCAGLAVEEAIAIVKELSGYAFVVASSDLPNLTANMLSRGDCRASILSLVKKADPSVDDVSVERVEVDTGRTRANGTPIKRIRYRIMMTHLGLDGQKTNLPMYGMGSLGTRKAFELAGPIFAALAQGRVLFIDELDSRLHPILTREIIKLFNNPTTNPKNAQLIFNTHDTNLLNCKVYTPSRGKKEQLLRRDQIYFVERTGEYVSKIYSLVEFKDEEGASVRNDASFEKEYLEGRYGAIPFIGASDFSLEAHG